MNQGDIYLFKTQILGPLQFIENETEGHPIENPKLLCLNQKEMSPMGKKILNPAIE